jgi:formylglycine-generating enzyme required for sulfatase activity
MRGANLSREVYFVDPRGQRTLAEDDFPLHVGRSASAEIRVPGPVADVSFGLIGILDDRPFLQPSGSAGQISVNGDPLTATRWLEDGDVFVVPGVRVECALAGDRWTITVSNEDIEYDTLPPEPESAPASEADGQQSISPVHMRRTAPAEPDQAVRRRPLLYAGYGVLAVLLLFAFYLFTASAVLLNVEPESARVNIAGGLLKMQFGGRYLLRSGEYRVVFNAEGYEPLHEVIHVGDEANQEFEFVMHKLPGRLVVEAPPGAQARVFVDDQELGPAPTAELALEPGPHSIRVLAERYQPYETTLEIAGRDILQTLEADLIPGWAELELVSQPPGASVFSGDEELARTPATIELIAGVHELTVQKEGYKIWRQSVTVVAGENRAMPEIILQESDGVLAVMSVPGGAAVSIDGRYRGTTPIEAELAPGRSYEVMVSKPGYASVSRNVEMQARRGRTLRIELEARVGLVKINSRPADAELYVDGEHRGAASQELTLPAREHRIEIRKNGFESYIADITPKPGLPQLLNVTLLTPEQAILAATPQTMTTSQGGVLRLVKPGAFETGAPRREQGRRPNESQRRVQLTKPFYIGLKEITNTQFQAFRPRHTSGAEKYRELAVGDHPAVMLSWQDAALFCNWLSEQDSLPPAYAKKGGELALVEPNNIGYRLPTEAEWVWVARYNAGGETRKYPWGARMPPGPGAGNYADLSARGIMANVLNSYDDGFPVTSPVGQFPASPLGLFDLGGNVSEWVSDRYTVYSGQQDVDIDPVGPAEGQYHVIRGAGWQHSSISELRFAYRGFGDKGRLDVGFRIARYVEPGEE